MSVWNVSFMLQNILWFFLSVNCFQTSLITCGNKEADTRALRKLDLHILSNWMGYDRGYSFPFDLDQMKFYLVQKIERKTVTTIMSHSMWKEMET